MINGDYAVKCRRDKDRDEVFVPFSLIQKYFEVSQNVNIMVLLQSTALNTGEHWWSSNKRSSVQIRPCTIELPVQKWQAGLKKLMRQVHSSHSDAAQQKHVAVTLKQIINKKNSIH